MVLGRSPPSGISRNDRSYRLLRSPSYVHHRRAYPAPERFIMLDDYWVPACYASIVTAECDGLTAALGSSVVAPFMLDTSWPTFRVEERASKAKFSWR